MWTKSSNQTTEQKILSSLFKAKLFIPILIHISNATYTFWFYFNKTLSSNKKIYDSKCQILFIIAKDFIYNKLQNNLDISIFFDYYQY